VIEWWPRLVARVQTSIHIKLLVAFLVIVTLMLVSGAVGLGALSEVNQRTADMVQLQRKIAAYRQLNHDTISQLYSVASALLKPEARRLDATLRQLNQFGYDLDRLQFVAQDEVELLQRVRGDYEEFIAVVTRAIQLIREGRITAGRDLQLSRATPLADRLERLTNELVNKAEAEMVARVEVNNAAYAKSMQTVAVFAIVSIVLALALGYGISVSLVGPVRAMEKRMHEIATGDFTNEVKVPNRDELGTLAVDLNSMSERLGGLYRELEATSQHKSEFLANMSHELRTPLNAVIGFSEVLQQKMFGDLNEKQMEYVDDIYSSGRHLLSLINDILDLSKIEAGKLELERSSFDLPNCIENALMLVRERASRHGLTMTLSVDESLGEIEADERKVRQILLNLLSNAVKFTPDGGKIEIAAGVVDGSAQIAVKDTGIGIASEDQTTIFEEFQQVGGVYKGKQEGTGLGLALARKFVELHGGRIWVDSIVGDGTTFTFTLPLTARTDHSAPDSAEARTELEDSELWAAN
jgi:signal transduction histidine kinase